MYQDGLSHDEHRRQIGLTIDPATAQMTSWQAAMGASMDEPYDILDPNEDQYFARNPNGEWVLFEDLPEATRKALWGRYKRELGFPTD
jgi:hypothetical protein